MLSLTEIVALITAGLGGLGLGVKALVEWRGSGISERAAAISEMKALIEASAKIREELQEELERRGEDLLARITRRDQKIIELEAHVANMLAPMMRRDQKIIDLEAHVADLLARITQRDQKIIELEAHTANMQREIDLLRAENAKLLGMGCVRAVCERREMLPVQMPQ